MARDDMCPTEMEEQTALLSWARLAQGKWPELALLYHVPNEGKRSRTAGARMKAEGLKKGVPDLCLPVARGGCHGLYIELKRVRGGRVSDDQQRWLDALNEQGYFATVCRGWQQAAAEIQNYLGI